MGESARRLLRGAVQYLAPGVYIKAGPDLWRRVGSGPIPEHVRRTKGRARDRRLRPRLSALRATLRELPHVVIVGRSSKGTAEVVIRAFDGGMVLIDRRRSRVLRSYGGGGVDDQYIAWRESFTRHVPAPVFEVLEGRRMIAEEFVDGQHLLDVDPDTRLRTVRELLSAYASLTAEEGRRIDAASFRRRLEAAVDPSRVPDDLLDEWQMADTGWLAEPLAWVPSAYEATVKNLMVRTSGAPAPIDLGDLREEPFFSYPVGIITEVGGLLLEQFLSGELDREMSHLFAAAGLVWAGHRPQRAAVVVARMLHAAACDDESGADTLSRSVHRRWAALAPQLRR